MKKYLFMLLWTACAVACSDSDPAQQPDEEGPTPPPDKEQQAVCGIKKPEGGASVNLAEKLTIAGMGAVTVGEIEKVVLKVGGAVVPEVADVPFEIEYTFPAGQAEGELKLELSVEGDAGATASAEVTVTTYRKEGPAAPVEGTMTDARDGNVYKTVKLADQVWMAENLRYLPEQHNDVSNTEPRYYIWADYDKDTQLGAEALKVYGAFYNWPAALQGAEPQTSAGQTPVRGVCPEGWHIPSQAEWQQLAQYVLDAGMAAMSNSNGSTSSIYGSFFMGVSDSVAAGAQSINAGEMAAAFKAGLKSMRDVVKGDVGDKTCFDSLIPAVEAMQNCGDVAQALSAAAEAAERGASGTVNLRAKFGRARNSAEASVGTLDPGAVSNAMIFAEFAKSFKGK